VSREVHAAGGVLWRRRDDQPDGPLEVALVHRPKYDDWSLPKGKLEPGEPAVAGALREIHEETGFFAVPGRTLGVSRYRVLDSGRDVAKTVQWWAMRAVAGEFAPTAEVDSLRWLEVRAALATVSAGYDAAPLRSFAAGPPDTVTLLLVRHGSAGDRESWVGDDDERPLDEEGLAQAEAMTAVLPLYEPRRVLSAPLVRCVETVRPLAERLGGGVELVDAAREDENAGGAEFLTALLRGLARAGDTAVVCSQGGVIADAVRALSGVSDVRERKGSVWALSFDGDRLVDAHYTPRLVDPS
jgi:8-oxo-dGTP diphosphatase